MSLAKKKRAGRPKRRDTAPRKLPVQQRSRENIERMLEAAAAVLEEEGYDQLKTVTIAEKAGAAVGSIYQYFPNKHAILTVLVERWLAADNMALEEVESSKHQYNSIVEEFVDLAKLMIENYRNQRGLLALVNLIHNIPELYEMGEAHDKQYARRLAKIIDRHGLKADRAEKLALAGYFTIIVDAAAMSIAMETKNRATLKERFILDSVRDLFGRYL
jgi:AcrR family transcriptional regulator